MFEPLLKYSSIFLKEAGLLKVPEKTLREVEEWALSIYFSKLVNILFQKLKKLFPEKQQFDSNKDLYFSLEIPFDERSPYKDLILIIADCKKYIKQKTSSNEIFYIKSNKTNTLYSFTVSFVFSDIENKQASWNDDVIFSQKDIDENEYFRLGFLSLYQSLIVPKNSEDVNEIADSIKLAIRHELQHLIQTLIKCETGQVNSGKAQLKSKIRNSKNNEKNQYESFNLQHAGINEEFYTRLTDSIEYFKRIIRKIPTELKKDFLKVWIGLLDDRDFIREKIQSVNELNQYLYHDCVVLMKSHDMFESWKEYEPEKYKKAVKEFYKEVQNLL